MHPRGPFDDLGATSLGSDSIAGTSQATEEAHFPVPLPIEARRLPEERGEPPPTDRSHRGQAGGFSATVNRFLLPATDTCWLPTLGMQLNPNQA